MIISATIKAEVYDSHTSGGILSDLVVVLPDATEEDWEQKATDFIRTFLPQNGTYKEAMSQFSAEELYGQLPYNLHCLGMETEHMRHQTRGNPYVVTAHITPTTDEIHARLTANDIVPLSAAFALDDDGTCMCCMLSEMIDKILSDNEPEGAVNCPVCGKVVTGIPEMTAVQEANYYEPQHRVGRYPMLYCAHCNTPITMVPQAIEYSPGHDVYYTGGARYLLQLPEGYNDAAKEILDIFNTKLWPDIKQYITRKLHPKDQMDRLLTMDNAHMWAEQDFTAAMAEFFYKHGLKV